MIHYCLVTDNIKTKIRDEFYEVLGLLNFDEKGHDIFKRWYIDGRIYFHKVIDPKSPRKGLTELRYIDPRKIKKVREVKKKRDIKNVCPKLEKKVSSSPPSSQRAFWKANRKIPCINLSLY